MISVSLARDLRAAGLRWEPTRGDWFIVLDRGMDDERFVLSDMTIEVHEHASGPVIGFNGTTEWALDSLDQQDALWLPAEHQLRAALGAAFVRLEVSAGRSTVVVELATGQGQVSADTVDDAYGRALLLTIHQLGVAGTGPEPAQ